jgi:hypothetical protein
VDQFKWILPIYLLLTEAIVTGTIFLLIRMSQEFLNLALFSGSNKTDSFISISIFDLAAKAGDLSRNFSRISVGRKTFLV